MLPATHLIGFGAKRSATVPTTPQDVPGGTGTGYVGDMTAGGGLSTGYDGNTAQGWYVGPAKSNSTSAYIGRTYAAGKYIQKATIHPNTTYGISADSCTYTVTLRGKNGAPSSATDGTLLGTTLSIPNGQSTAFTVTSTDQSTAYTHVWVVFAPSILTNTSISEIVITELV